MADRIVSWGGFDSKSTSGMGVTGSLSISSGSIAVSGPNSMSFSYTINDTSPTFIKMANGGSGVNTGGTIAFPYGTITGNYGGITLTNSGGSSYSLGLGVGGDLNWTGASFNLQTSGNSLIGSGGVSGTSMTFKSGGSFVFNSFSGGFRDVIKFSQAGNLQVGGFTDAARLEVKGSGTTSSTTALLVQNANASSSLQVKDDLTSTFGGSMTVISNDYAGIDLRRTVPNSQSWLQLYATGDFNPVLFKTQGVDWLGYVRSTSNIFLNRGNQVALNDNSGVSPTGSIISSDIHIYNATNSPKLVFWSPFSVQTPRGQISTSDGTSRGGNLIFSVNNNNLGLSALTEYMRITQVGNVGIGTSTPSASLHISGASSNVLFEIDSPAVNNILFVSGSGNVGIGTGTPNYRLDISGSTNHNGNVIITGSATNSLLVKGSGATSSTTSFLVQDSNGNSAFQVKDDRSAIVYGPLSLSRANQGYIYYGANDYIQFPRQGGPAPGYFNTSTAGDGWAFRIATNNQTYARIMEGSFYLEAYTPDSNGRNSIRTWFSGSNFVYIDGDGVTGRSPAYGNGVNVIIRGGKSGGYENLAQHGAAGYVTVEGGSAFSGSFTTHIAGAGVNIQTGLGLGTGSAADLTFSTSTTSSVASTYHTQTQRMVIKGQTGNIGIGTATPSASLHISGASNSALFEIDSPAVNNILFVSGSGRVGIGTSSPNAGLEVANAEQSSFRITRNSNTGNYLELTGGASGGTYNINTSGTQAHIFQTAGTERARITSDGNVGIGTSNPSARLHVSGAIGDGIVLNGPSSVSILIQAGNLSGGSGTVQLFAGNNNNTYLRLASEYIREGSNGGLGINVSREDITAKFQVKGSGVTSSTTSFLVQNANASASFSVKDGNPATAATTGKFQVIAGSWTDSAPYTVTTWRTSSFASAKDITIGSEGVLNGYSSRLNFINYYSNGGQGSISDLSGYIRTSISQYTATGGGGGAQGSGRGTLLLGVYDTDYSSVALNSFDVVSVGKYDTRISGSLTITGPSAAVTMPSRPAFRVTGSGTMTNLTTTQNGDGTLNQNNWVIDYQQGSALTGSTGVFTAPLAGLYQISLVGRNSGYSSGISQLAVVKYSGASSAVQIMVEWASSSTMNHTGGSSITYMNVGDTLKLKILAGEINFDGNDNWSVAYIG